MLRVTRAFFSVYGEYTHRLTLISEHSIPYGICMKLYSRKFS